MDMLNRIKSAVTSALPVGIPITGEFEIHSHRASGGPGLLWKIFDAVQKSTKQEASVFLFEKKNLDRFNRADREVVLEVLKKGVSQLTRLRHPKILSVLHTLEDSRESLAFATEPVFASLSNVLGHHENLPNPAPTQFKDFTLFDVEIKYGLLQVIEGLTFLHSSVKMVHGNLCPESIFINKMGCWKIAGFEFCINNTNQSGLQPYYPMREWEPHVSPVAQPRLNYLAPEYVLTASCDTTSDMFSLGVLIFSIHSGGRTVHESLDDWTTFKRNIEDMKSLRVSRLSDVPDLVRDHIKMLLNTEPTVRPDSDQLSKIPFFEDVGAMTLQYLDMLVQKDNLQKSQFFKGLPSIIAKLPKRVNLQRVLPSLSKECINHSMVPFVLPCLIQIAELTADDEFAALILPELIPLFKITNPIQVMLILLQNMGLLLNKCPQADVRNHILPMITRALEAGMPQMQELCLNIIPTFANLIEYTSLKNAIVPRIRKLYVAAPTLSIRVNCLVCLGKLLEFLDRWYVLDEVLPILLEVPSKEPAVLMSILGVLKVMLTHKKLGITKEMLSTKVLPFLFPLCIDNSLNLTQFNAFIAIIKDMVSRVEAEHRTKLEQLNTVQTEEQTLQKFAQEAVQGGSGSAASNGSQATSGSATMMDSFLSDIGYGRTSSADKSSNGGVSNTKGGGTRNVLDQSPQEERPSGDANTKYNKNTSAAPLTMAEKEKLARDQELQKQLKSQPALFPASSSMPSMSVDSNSRKTTPSTPKDLSSTLLNSSYTPPTSAYHAYASAPMMTAPVRQPILNTGSGMDWGMSSSSPSGHGGNMSGGVSWGTGGGAAAPPSTNRAIDLSSLDSVLPMSKPKLSMGQMATSGGSSNMPMGMMGNSGITGGNVGNPFSSSAHLGGGGFQTGAGIRPLTTSSNFGQSQPGFGPPMNFNQSQSRPLYGNAQQTSAAATSSKPLSSKDIADLLG